MPKALALVVKRSRGQAGVVTARKMGILNDSLRISVTGEELSVPLMRQPSSVEAKHLTSEVGFVRIEEREFNQRTSRRLTLVDALRRRLPGKALAALPHSMDVIGDIVVVELSSELVGLEQAIGEAILEIHPNIHTVMAKAGAFSSEYRTRELRLIAGEDKSTTRHKEHGCLFELDVRSVFFSSRLSHERLRVASQVHPNEIVLDMFAGVGPYSILIARKQPTTLVHAVDANPSAYHYLVSNILANKVHSNTKALLGDVREIVKSSMRGIADRAVMNLPGEAEDFVDIACLGLKKRGGVIHFYSFEKTERSRDSALEKLSGGIEASGRKIKTILARRVVKEVAPYQVQVAVDVRVGPQP